MATTVDSLNIQISTQASKAITSVDNLARKLNTLSTSLSRINGSGLTGLANGVNKLSTAMQSMKTVGTADFTRLAKNIEKLGNINTANLNSAASSMSHLTRAFNQLGGVSANAQQVGILASNLSKLGYKSINNAITNLPALTNELNNLMTTLSNAPVVSNNVIQMTNALANLASQGGKVGTASNALVNGLNRSTSTMNRATKSSKSLASAMGKLYAKWFLVVRGVKKLWSSVESSMNYIEVLNYFDAAFTQVAEKADLSSWQELGYASAEEYASSFAERAKELTSKMTGFEISPTGTLEATGMPSLGLDPSQLMNYQAMFGQMASSMGVASETAVKLSGALSMIGADLASVKNLDFEDVWEDMASGLAGMSRTLDKYGVNIRNVNLQQKLTEIGIEANITALNQNDKALLRTIILLDSTRYAWGDLADTINQPANQMRLLEANLKNLARTIGNIFLPVVASVIPYINGLVIALQRLAQRIVDLLGFTGFDWGGLGGGDEDIFSDLYDQAEEAAGGIDDAAQSAKELKNQLLGFDEITKLSDVTDTGTIDTSTLGTEDSALLDKAFSDALEEYKKRWDEAYASMENRAQEFADKFEKYLEPIQNIIFDLFSGDFTAAGEDISRMAASILNFFTESIRKVNWKKVGESIGDFLEGIDWGEILKSLGKLIWEAINAAIKLWSDTFQSAPIETTIITALALIHFYNHGKSIGSSILSGVNGSLTSEKSITKFKNSLSSLLSKGVLVVGAAVAGWNIGQYIAKELGYDTEDGFITQMKEIFHSGDAARGAFSSWGSDIYDAAVEFGNFLNGYQTFSGLAIETNEEIEKTIDGIKVSGRATEGHIKSTKQKYEDFVRELNILIDGINSEVEITAETSEAESSISSFKENTNKLLGKGMDLTVRSNTIESLKNIDSFVKSANLTISKVNAIMPEVNTKDADSKISSFVENIKKEFNGIKFNFEVSGNIKEKISEFFKKGIGAIFDFGKIKAYSVGGFPEDGLFYANHNEIVGKFTNGKTAVANNEQIIEGIKRGVYEALVQANYNSGGRNETPIIKVYVGERELTEIAIDGINNRIKSSGVSPIYI
uniref:Minor tail protein n=1 Tax=Dulem virus 39 TaxID=3145757 RepID=A0AAU8B7Q7_9CAUD